MNSKSKLVRRGALSASLALAAVCLPAAAQVGVSIGINQPGVYGRITLGDVPPPALILSEPVLVSPPARYVERRPIYLYVPPEHQRNWRRYCSRYSACNQPVYFVREEWVRERYEREHPGWDRGRHRGADRSPRDRHDNRDHRDDGNRRDDDHRGGPHR